MRYCAESFWRMVPRASCVELGAARFRMPASSTPASISRNLFPGIPISWAAGSGTTRQRNNSSYPRKRASDKHRRWNAGPRLRGTTSGPVSIAVVFRASDCSPCAGSPSPHCRGKELISIAPSDTRHVLHLAAKAVLARHEGTRRPRGQKLVPMRPQARSRTPAARARSLPRSASFAGPDRKPEHGVRTATGTGNVLARMQKLT